MGSEHSAFSNQRLNGFRSCRGISLLLIIFLMTMAAASAVAVLTFGVKLRAITKERMVPERLDTVRRALQRYYLSHHDLPSPTYANAELNNTVPVKALNLPQEYRLDSSGEFIRYDRFPFDSGVVDIQGLMVQGEQVAAVLVAPGANRQIEPSNSEPNDTEYDQTGDDIVVAVSLQAEAIKIATRAVAVLQAAAKGYDAQYNIPNNGQTEYDAQFDNANNDGDYRLTTTRGATVSITIDPGPDGILGTSDDFDVVDISAGADGIFCTGDDVPPPSLNVNDPLDPFDDTYDCRVLIRLNGKIDEGNEVPVAHSYDGYVPADGGVGTGCVRVGRLVNDPERGTASLDGCDTAAADIVAVFGLSERYITDPWGNAYVWGSVEWVDSFGGPLSAYGGLAATSASDNGRDRRYWAFFSMGPDETADTEDDITPVNFIVGYYATEPPP